MQRQIFADVETGRLNGDGKRACDKLGVNAEDLIEKKAEDIRHEARYEIEPLTEEVIGIRLQHFELRRRKKLKLACD